MKGGRDCRPCSAQESDSTSTRPARRTEGIHIRWHIYQVVNTWNSVNLSRRRKWKRRGDSSGCCPRSWGAYPSQGSPESSLRGTGGWILSWKSEPDGWSGPWSWKWSGSGSLGFRDIDRLKRALTHGSTGESRQESVKCLAW